MTTRSRVAPGSPSRVAYLPFCAEPASSMRSSRLSRTDREVLGVLGLIVSSFEERQ